MGNIQKTAGSLFHILIQGAFYIALAFTTDSLGQASITKEEILLTKPTKEQVLSILSTNPRYNSTWDIVRSDHESSSLSKLTEHGEPFVFSQSDMRSLKRFDPNSLSEISASHLVGIRNHLLENKSLKFQTIDSGEVLSGSIENEFVSIYCYRDQYSDIGIIKIPRKNCIFKWERLETGEYLFVKYTNAQYIQETTDKH